jgi:hypothetical protein
MKMYIKIIGATLFMTIALAKANAQNPAKDSTGFPGDNFSLQGALQLFQKASSPEEFEKLVNTKDKNVNNLDLNKDGKTDYVKVIDKSEKKSHALILQVPVSQTESQDIAVIELEKTGDTTAMIQIIGDKDVYGKEIIIEPDGDKKDLVYNEWNSSTHGPANGYTDDNAYTVVVNVWYWPSVTFIYGPVYTPWVSPWRWGYYPGWWVTWRPVAWTTWYPRAVVYNRNYVAVNTYRVTGAHYLYTPYRSSAVAVSRTTAIAAGPNGVAAASKTTVTGPAGRSATRVSGVVAGPNGAARVTTVRRGRF